MSNRRFEVFHYRQALLRMRQGESDRAIHKAGLMGRQKAAELRLLAEPTGWLDAASPLPDDAAIEALFNKKKGGSGPTSSLEPHRERVKNWIEEGVSGVVMLRVLRQSHGYGGSYSSLQRLVRQISDTTPRVTTVLDFAPGEAAQVDFGKGPPLIDTDTGEIIKSWFFVMVLAWSRHQYAELVTDQTVETWLGCHRRSFEHFNGVPAKVIIDNPKCAITRACYYDPLVQRAYADFAEGYGFMISPCPVADPQKKGIVESGVKFAKNNFMPLRDFRDPVDANVQLMRWVMTEAGTRIHGTTRVAPLTRFAETEQALLRALPATPPEVARWAKAKVHADCHIQVDKRRYSAPYTLVGKTLDVRLSETTVRLYHEHEMRAVHPHLTHPGQRSTLDEHLPPEHVAFKMRTPVWCQKEADRIGPYVARFIERQFENGVIDNLRSAQGVLALKKTYGAVRLDAACRRALAFENLTYRTVNTILKQGLDQVADPEGAFDELAGAYTGTGRFGRSTRDLFDKPH